MPAENHITENAYEANQIIERAKLGATAAIISSKKTAKHNARLITTSIHNATYRPGTLYK